MNLHNQVNVLLDDVSRVLRHKRELEVLRGEQFNIFSILRMETRENAAHSSFIGALLDPDGSHLKGTEFLELFCKTVECEQWLDPATTKVHLEKSIGKRDMETETGGRLDILLQDSAGNCITIENKIYAGDQDGQIKRYRNFENGRNRVFYLTLHGTDPSPESKRGLEAGSDFFLLSYKEDIRKWLSACMKEAADSPMLRETIKQYLILIRKMTNTGDDKMQQELTRMLLKNGEAASFITSNFEAARDGIGDDIRYAVKDGLRAVLPQELEVSIETPVQNRFAQVWVWVKDNRNIFIGIESFNSRGHNGNKGIFIGVFTSDKAQQFRKTTQLPKYNNWWYGVHEFAFNGAPIHFSDNEMLLKIHDDPQFRQDLIDRIVKESAAYIREHKEAVFGPLLKPADA